MAPKGSAPLVASLVVVGLPRSLSTFVQRHAGRALGLPAPSWAGAGEILNLDRHVLNGGPQFDESRKFLTAEQHPVAFGQVLDLLDDVVRTHGRRYKDVVQPFAMAAWLRANPRPTLVLDRPLADVALAVLVNRWHYPATAAWALADRDGAILEGLARAEHALSTVAGERVAFDDLVHDEQALAGALSRLYPDADIALGPYRDERFVAEARRQVARRITPRYRELTARLADVRSAVAAGGPPPAAAVEHRPFGRATAESIRRLACELLPDDAAVGVVDLGAPELRHLEGRRTWPLPGPATDLVAAFDAARAAGMDHVLVARPESGATDAQDALAARLAAGRPLHHDLRARLVALDPDPGRRPEFLLPD